MEGISVIIPTFNSQKYISEAIQSVLSQRYDGHLEVIISDDGSTDKTVETAKSFGNKVSVLTKSNNCLDQGAAGARNRGLIAAKQPFICFLDSDDFYLPGHLNKMVKIMTNNANLGFAFCRTLSVKEENDKRLFKQWSNQRIYKNDIINPVVSRSQVVNTNSFMFRREVFDKIGYFNESYSNVEDSDLWMRISEKYRGAFSNHFGVVYNVQHGGNQLTKNSKEVIEKCHYAVFLNALNRYFNLGLSDKNRLFQLKHELLACKYKKARFLYLINYLFLITQHPIPFIKRIPPYLYNIYNKKKSNQWHELSHFL